MKKTIIQKNGFHLSWNPLVGETAVNGDPRGIHILYGNHIEELGKAETLEEAKAIYSRILNKEYSDEELVDHTMERLQELKNRKPIDFKKLADKCVDRKTEDTTLKSSVASTAPVVNQYIQFADGSEKTFKGVKTDTITQSQFTRFELTNGTTVYVNTNRVNFFEVHAKK